MARLVPHLGRNLQEDLSLHPDGIQDFGEEIALTAIDVVLKFGGAADAQQAALWLCEQIGGRGKFGVQQRKTAEQR